MAQSLHLWYSYSKSYSRYFIHCTRRDRWFGTEGEVATRGLKYNHKEVINSQAGGLLQDTDWMVVRAAEGGTAVPCATTTWRAAVRTKANAMCTAIDGAADVDALAALYVYNRSLHQ